jgi:hypothetical protein
VVERRQFTKQAIEASEALAFHSNWRVVGLSVACALATLAMGVATVFGLDALGIPLPD